MLGQFSRPLERIAARIQTLPAWFAEPEFLPPCAMSAL
jgi:hypothetical protein